MDDYDNEKKHYEDEGKYYRKQSSSLDDVLGKNPDDRCEGCYHRDKGCTPCCIG